ncbi:MAG: hypothetical protein ACE5HV_10335 [Acidobacteriota bacterium]
MQFSATANREPRGMLDEPALSRQWVIRRLQRVLALERWCGPFRRGLARPLEPPYKAVLTAHADASATRAASVSRLIVDLRGTPYPTLGLAPPVAAAAGWCVARVSRRMALAACRRIAGYTLASYDGLMALGEDAAGVPEAVPEKLGSLLESTSDEVHVIRQCGKRRVA